MRQKRYRPHDIHGGSREHERRSPDPIFFVISLALVRIKPNTQSRTPNKRFRLYNFLLCNAMQRGSQGIRPDVRLILAFGRENPYRGAEYQDDYEADEGRPAIWNMLASLLSACFFSFCLSRGRRGGRTRLPLLVFWWFRGLRRCWGGGAGRCGAWLGGICRGRSGVGGTRLVWLDGWAGLLWL